MAKVERIDYKDSMSTMFRCEIAPNEHQEISVPIFLADLSEQELKKAGFDFDTEKAKKGNKTIID